MAAEPTNSSYERFGLALNDEELREVDRRMMIQQNYADVVAAAVGEEWSEELVEGLDPAGSFGPVAGYWTDQQDGGRLQLALVGGDRRADRARDAVGLKIAELVSQGRLTKPDDVRVRDAQFSLDEIYRVNREFGEQYLPNEVTDPILRDPEGDTGFGEQPQDLDRIGSE